MVSNEPTKKPLWLYVMLTGLAVVIAVLAIYLIALFAYTKLLVDAKHFFDAHDYEKARPLLELAAILGDTWAKNNLGWTYQNGIGVEANFGNRNLLQAAAKVGDTHATDNLSSRIITLPSTACPSNAPTAMRLSCLTAFSTRKATDSKTLSNNLLMCQQYPKNSL